MSKTNVKHVLGGVTKKKHVLGDYDILVHLGKMIYDFIVRKDVHNLLELEIML